MRDPLWILVGLSSLNHLWWSYLICKSLSSNKWLWRTLRVVMYWGTAGDWSWNPSMHWTDSVQLKFTFTMVVNQPSKNLPFSKLCIRQVPLNPNLLITPEANVCSSRWVLWSAIAVPCQLVWLQLARHTWSLNLAIDLPQSGIKCPIITCHKDFRLLSQCSTWLYQNLPQRALWREQASLP